MHSCEKCGADFQSMHKLYLHSQTEHDGVLLVVNLEGLSGAVVNLNIDPVKVRAMRDMARTCRYHGIVQADYVVFPMDAKEVQVVYLGEKVKLTVEVWQKMMILPGTTKALKVEDGMKPLVFAGEDGFSIEFQGFPNQMVTTIGYHEYLSVLTGREF